MYILIPRGSAPFGQHQESWLLAQSNTGNPWFMDFPSFCACSESSLTNLIGWVCKTITLRMLRKLGLPRSPIRRSLASWDENDAHELYSFSWACAEHSFCILCWSDLSDSTRSFESSSPNFELGHSLCESGCLSFYFSWAKKKYGSIVCWYCFYFSLLCLYLRNNSFPPKNSFSVSKRKTENSSPKTWFSDLESIKHWASILSWNCHHTLYAVIGLHTYCSPMVQ